MNFYFKMKSGMGFRKVVLAVITAALVVSQGRPAAAAEGSLVGIKIFSRAKTVLAKFGNPTSIEVGRNFSLNQNGKTAPTGQLGSPSLSPGALPGFGAAPIPATPGVGSFSPPSAASGTTTPDPSNGEVTWVYDRPNGVNYEFTLSAGGNVVQIRVTGFRGSARTGKGIALGQNYGQVLQKYGFPEQQITTQSSTAGSGGLGSPSAANGNAGGSTPSISFNVLTIYYVQRQHVAFQFINQKLVGIIVAAVG